MSMRSMGLVIGVATAGLLMSACRQGQDAGQAGAAAFPPATVKLVAAQATNIEDATEYVATLKSLRSTTIQPQIDGQITQIYVRSGERVKEGARLMLIDPRRQQAAVSSQEAERAAREANVAYARQQAQRATELYGAGAISHQELEQAETTLKTAQANLNALQAQVRQQEVQLHYYTVAAPTSGIVGDVPVRVGNQVTTSTVLTTVDQNDTLEVYVPVPVERSPDLKLGLPLQVLSGDSTRRLAETTTSFISPHVDPDTQSILVKGIVRNPGAELRSSQFVRARIVWKTARGLVIPVTAVLRLNGQNFAFIAEQAQGDGGARLVARQRPVKLGPIAGNDYAVLDGLKPNDQVVVSGVQKLADGAPIQPET